MCLLASVFDFSCSISSFAIILTSFTSLKAVDSEKNGYETAISYIAASKMRNIVFYFLHFTTEPSQYFIQKSACSHRRIKTFTNQLKKHQCQNISVERRFEKVLKVEM